MEFRNFSMNTFVLESRFSYNEVVISALKSIFSDLGRSRKYFWIRYNRKSLNVTTNFRRVKKFVFTSPMSYKYFRAIACIIKKFLFPKTTPKFEILQILVKNRKWMLRHILKRNFFKFSGIFNNYQITIFDRNLEEFDF